MTQFCDYCRGPITSASYLGRPWPDRPTASYCCYGCLSLGEFDREEQNSPNKERRRFAGFGVRLGIGILVAGQSMIFGLAINLDEQTPPSVKLGVQGVILAGTLLVMALLGLPLFRTALTEIRRGQLTIESLFLLTMAGAFFASMQSFISGHGPIYFEVVTIVLVIYTLGKAIGSRSRSAAIASAERWATSLKYCRIIDRLGQDRQVDVATVKPGDIIEVHPGEAIAVDGVVREGVGFVSEAPVNGEPFATTRRPGDRVLSGMVSHDATFRIESSSSGSTRQIDSLLQAVEEARGRPISLQAQADRFGRLLFPLIVVVAIGTFAVWTYLSSWQTGLFNAMSVLLVACPCALGLATPIVLWSALNRLTERGLVVRAGDVIERLAQVGSVVFDKSGTLTEDQFALVDIVTLAEGSERARLLGWLAIVERQSNHPIARAFAKLPVDEALRVLSFNVIPGQGVVATLETHDQRTHHLRIGRPEWIGVNGTADEESLASQLRGAGNRIDVELDGRLAAIALINERLRDCVSESLTTLEQMNLRVSVLTGDAGNRAVSLGLPNVQGGLLPDEKRQQMEKIKAAGGRPLMVGDGINDASALAAAHVGIALASGTDLANHASSATLYHGDLRVIPWAIFLCREAMRTIRANLRRAAGYNLIGIGLAASGILHPVAAALLMAISSVWTVWASARIGVAPHSDSCAAECPSVATDSAWRGAIVHGVAIFLQAVVAIFLLQLSVTSTIAVLIIGAVFGCITAWVWNRWSTMPHWVDMSMAMITCGNLGMLLGWWADNGFARLHDFGCCECVEAMRAGVMKPWMWVGMLAFANLAMALLSRQRNAQTRICRVAMFTGGNVGMVAGMLLGGWLGGQLNSDAVAIAALMSFLGMTAGMIAGMHIGTQTARIVLTSLSEVTRQRSEVRI